MIPADSLLGRDAEIQAIVGLLDEARLGRGGALAVVGEAGIGKTALLREAAARAGDLELLQTRGVESGATLAFGGLRDLLGPLLDRLDLLPAPQRSALGAALALAPPVQPDRFAVYAAALGLLSAVESPTLVLVDDAHWLDAPSAEAILFVARRLRDVPMALLLAGRDEEGLKLSGVPELRLGALEKDAARALVRRHAGAPSDHVLDAVVRAAGGNPLALEELPAVLPEDVLRGARALPDPLPVGPTLERALMRRLGGLPGATAAALAVVAAAGDVPASAVFPVLAELDLDAAALESAEAAGVVSVVAGRVEFRHPLLRAAAYQAVDTAERAAAHAALANAFESDPERRAWHLAAAATAPSENVASTLETVALGAAARSAFAVAASGLERAAELSTDPAAAARRRLAAAQQAFHAGRFEWTSELLDSMRIPSGHELLEAEAENLRGTLQRGSGIPGEARRHQQAAAIIVEPHDPELAALIHVNAAMSDMMAGEMDAALEAARRADAVAPRDEWTRGVVELMLAFTRVVHGDRSAGGLVEAIEAVARSEAPRPELAMTGRIVVDTLATTYVYVAEEGLEGLLDLLAAAIGAARTAGALGVLPYLLANESMMLFRIGRPRQALPPAEEAIGLARDTGQPNYLAWALINAARPEAVLGHEASCRAHLEETRAIAEAQNIGAARTHVLSIEGLLELTLGRPREAAAVLERCARLTDRQQLRNPGVIRWRADYIEALVQVDERARALAEVEILERQASACESIWGTSAAARGRLMLAGEDALESWFEAAATAERFVGEFEHARTQLCYAERLRQGGRRDDARAVLREAVDAFAEMGAEPWAERARNELRLAGGREPGSSAPDLSSLSEQEREVALLVGRGATNQEAAAQLFLSPKTVEAHLSRIYRKLDLRRRGELAHLVAATGRDESSQRVSG